MNERQFPGARWWKFDFHTHTPASADFRDQVTLKSWLKAFMEEEIDCVAITDHITTICRAIGECGAKNRPTTSRDVN